MSIWNNLGEFFLFRWLFDSPKSDRHSNYHNSIYHPNDDIDHLDRAIDNYDDEEIINNQVNDEYLDDMYDHDMMDDDF